MTKQRRDYRLAEIGPGIVSVQFRGGTNMDLMPLLRCMASVGCPGPTEH